MPQSAENKSALTSELKGNEIAVTLLPTALSLVTARAQDGSDKIATIAWVMPISHEPSMIAVAIRPNGQTSNAMAQGGAFVVNVLESSPEAKAAAFTCGKKQGVDDRFAQANLTRMSAKTVDAVRVDKCVSWIECKLVDHKIYGDHELFIGKTLLAETLGELDENGKLVPRPPLVMGQRASFGHFEED